MKPTSIKEIGDIAGKKVLLRLDLNVPMKDGQVVEDFRIRKSMPTLNFLISRGAKVIIISHCEGNKGATDNTLKPVFEHLKNTLPTASPIFFVEDYVNEDTVATVGALKNGEILLFENLRKYEGEKENDADFTKSLAGLADLFVNEAFSVSHREHASIVGIPKLLPSFIGLLFESEIEHLSKTFNPPRPFLFVLGGAKFGTKMPLIKKFLEIADTVFVGGALANDCFKALGYNVGTSVVSDGNFDLKDIVLNKKIVLPVDVVVKGDRNIDVKSPQEVRDDEMILDAGSESILQLEELVGNSRYVLWNGPLGNFEIGFKEGTLELARKIAGSSAESVVGGADTLAAISLLQLEDKFNFVSSGGGAMLDFLANGTLPGIEVLKR